MFKRWLMSVLAGVLWLPAAHAQNVMLTEAPLKDACVRNSVTMDVEGKQTVKRDEKEVSYPLKVSASHAYVERYLECNGAVADKAARFYTQAERTIRFNNDAGGKNALRPSRSFMAVLRIKDQIVSYSPKGMLTRDEVELTDHFDTMAVPGLLPGTQVAPGKTWSVPNHVVQALCGLSGITSQKFEGKLTEVKGSIAHVTLVGEVKGIDMGAEVAMIINGRLEFDTKDQRIVFAEWKQQDDRKQGPISPAMTANVVITLKRTPISMPAELNDNPLIPWNAPAHLTGLQHTDPAKRFELLHARDWHVVSPDKSPQLVMRLMERGDFIAQVTFSPWKKIDLKVVPTKEAFADMMAKTPGWAQEKEIACREIDKANMPRSWHKAYRVEASGELDGVKTWQNFYLIVSTQGEQMIVTFSMIPQHVQRLGIRDLELVRELVLP
jgi:hypothetical protein